jgi:tRNA(Arg) A34 adenosine deaminase TadA
MNHITYLLKANDIARKARANGNTPFGAVLVDPDGNVIMEQGNAEGDLHDATAHAERMLASRASQKYSKEFLWGCTLYTTFEPCCMCTGAIYWSNIGNIVYGLTEERLLQLTGADEKNPTFNISCRTILAAGQKPIEVLGPFDEIADQVVEVQKGFWNS